MHLGFQGPYQRNRNRYVTSFLPLISVVFVFIAGETILRTYHVIRYDVTFFGGLYAGMEKLSPITLDDSVGWRATKNYRFDGKKKNSDLTEYEVKLSQDHRGFRISGNVAPGNLRVFVIGDSFTQAVEVSDDKTYYAVFGKLLNVEVFAYAVGGYGSLQEFMILDKYFDDIKPDLILWQYSTNDLINNSLDLEAASRINNNGMIRPYWVDGRVIYQLPKHKTDDLRLFALRYCRVCYLILSRIDRLIANTVAHTVETETATGKPAHAAFVASSKTTNEIMGMVRKRVGSVPIVAFIVGLGSRYSGAEYENALKEISRRHNIILLNNVDRAVLAAEKAGKIVRAEDGAHWNELGHRIAGEAIAEALRSVGKPIFVASR